LQVFLADFSTRTPTHTSGSAITAMGVGWKERGKMAGCGGKIHAFFRRDAENKTKTSCAIALFFFIRTCPNLGRTSENHPFAIWQQPSFYPTLMTGKLPQPLLSALEDIM